MIDEIRTITFGRGQRVIPEWPPGSVVSDRFDEVEWRAFADPSGQLFGGTWEGQPGALFFESYPYHEICVILSGKVALIDLAGDRREFGSGDAFYVPAGFAGTWETIEPSTKYFFGFDPGPDAG